MITYRSNERNTLRAAYCGSVRIGYVESRERFTAAGWRWQLIMLQPDGGAYWGFVDDEQEAKTTLEEAFKHWLACAGLQHKDKTDDTRATERDVQEPEAGNSGGGRKEKQPRRNVAKRGADAGSRNRTATKRAK